MSAKTLFIGSIPIAASIKPHMLRRSLVIFSLLAISVAIDTQARSSQRPDSYISTQASKGQPTKPLVIVVFGASSTAPRGPLKIFARHLEERLGTDQRPVRVINSGIPGNNTRDARARLNKDVISYHPDFATIYFGTNDASIDVWLGKTEPRVPLKEYEENLSWIVEQMQDNGIQPILMVPPPVTWTDVTRKYWSKPPYRTDDPDGWNTLFEPYLEAVRRVAKARKVPLVDIYKLFKAYAAAPGHNLNDLLLDGMHPNDLGHSIIANSIIAIISSAH